MEVCVQIAVVVGHMVGRWQEILEVDCAAIFRRNLNFSGKFNYFVFKVLQIEVRY